MTTALTRPAWTTELEVETFDKLIDQYAPYLPKTRLHKPRPLMTQEELESFNRFRIAGTAHDLFIVQVCAKIIDQIPEPKFQLFLSKQIGDDGAHAQHAYQRLLESYGNDPIEEIKQEVQQHWDFMGDSPIRNWQSFLAFELHYEIHVVAMLLLNSRTHTMNDQRSGKFATEIIQPDEASHRLGVIAWWQSKYDQASLAEKAELAAQVLAVDEEIQRRRNPYLKDHWQIVQRAFGSEFAALPVIYDAWRQEVLSYFLDIPISNLPKLLSVNE